MQCAVSMPTLIEPSSLRIADVMSSPVTTLCASHSLPLARDLMAQRRIRHLPVVDDDQRLVGLVSHRDILRAQQSCLAPISEPIRSTLELAVPVNQLMTKEVWTTVPDAPALEAARQLLSHGFSCLPVVDEEQRVVGIVTEADFVDLVVGMSRRFARIEVATMMTRDVVTLREDDDLWTADTLVGLERIRHLPVIDERGHLAGLVTHRDLLAAQHARLTGGTQFPREARVSQLMRRDVWTTSPAASVLDAARTLSDHSYGCLPVVDRGKLIGIVTEADFMRLLVEHDDRSVDVIAVVLYAETNARPAAE
jgi:CBS domain-containing membrane protein